MGLTRRLHAALLLLGIVFSSVIKCRPDVVGFRPAEKELGSDYLAKAVSKFILVNKDVKLANLYQFDGTTSQGSALLQPNEVERIQEIALGSHRHVEVSGNNNITARLEVRKKVADVEGENATTNKTLEKEAWPLGNQWSSNSTSQSSAKASVSPGSVSPGSAGIGFENRPEPKHASGDGSSNKVSKKIPDDANAPMGNRQSQLYMQLAALYDDKDDDVKTPAAVNATATIHADKQSKSLLVANSTSSAQSAQASALSVEHLGLELNSITHLVGTSSLSTQNWVQSKPANKVPTLSSESYAEMNHPDFEDEDKDLSLSRINEKLNSIPFAQYKVGER